MALVSAVFILAACSSNNINSTATATPPSVQSNPSRDYLYSEVLVDSASDSANAAQRYGLRSESYQDVDVLDLASDQFMQLSNDQSYEDGVLPLGITLAEVWRNHPNVVRALSEVTATGFEISGAKTGYYPYVSISAAQASNDASQTTLSVVQPLWSGGRTRAEVKEAQANQSKALAELNSLRLNLGLETADAYLSVVLAEEQGMLWVRYIKSLEGLLGTISRRAEQGVSPPADIQTAQTRLSQARAGLAASNSVLLRNRLHLESLIHRSTVHLAWPDQSYALTPEESLRVLNNNAVSAHPSGQQVLSEIELQRANVRLAKSSIFPQLSLQYTTQLDQSAGDFTPDSSTQLVFQMQSNDGLRGINSYRAVLQRLHGAEQDLIYARRDVTDVLSTAYAERAVAENQFYAQVEAAGAAVKLVDSFLRQFKVGRKAWLEVLNAHREAHEALLQISTIRKNYWSANIRLALQGMLWTRLSKNAPPTHIAIKEE
jgi:adhesin transport system outer membrane protein